MDILNQTFTSGQVIAAAGITNHALQSWMRRKLVIGQKDIEGGGNPGSHRRFSFNNVMEISIAKALTDVGVPSVEHAFHAAHVFSHTGGIEPGDNVDRLPALPFDGRQGGRRTILAVAGDRAVVTHWAPKHDFYITACHRLNTKSLVALDVDSVFERVTQALGHDYRDVLAAAYPAENAAS